MSAYRGEHVCAECGHDFDQKVSKDELRCPRCGSVKLEHNPFLFGTSSADELTVEDYMETLLAPCCGDQRTLRNCALYQEPDSSKEG